MLGKKWIIFLSTVLVIMIVLLFIVLVILLIMIVTQKEWKRKQSKIREELINLLLSYSQEYYVPLNASIYQVCSELHKYQFNSSSDGAYKVFVLYCCYLYHTSRVFQSGIPLPFLKKERNEFLLNYNETINMLGLSHTQRSSVISALTSLSAKCYSIDNYEQVSNVLNDKIEELKIFEIGLSDSEKTKSLYEAFYKLRTLLSRRMSNLFDLSTIQTPREFAMQTLKEFWSELRNSRNLDKLPAEPEVEEEPTKLKLVAILTAAILGLSYMLIFIPIVWHSAEGHGLDPLNILLFAEISPDLQSDFMANLFPHFSAPSAQPTLFAMGACIGVLMFSGSLASMADPLKVRLTTKSLFLALGMTTGLGYILGTVPLEKVIFRIFLFKVGYLLATFMIFSSLPGLMGRKGVYRIKYEKLFSGLYGIIAGWLLSKGFGATAAIYNSALFFMSWFIAMVSYEFLYSHNPQFSAAPIHSMTFAEFGRLVWSKRRSLVPRLLLFVIVTLIFHFLIIVLYNNLLAGRF